MVIMSRMTHATHFQTEATMNSEKNYTAQEVADLKGVSKKTITRWVEDGYLPGTIKKGPYKNSPLKIPQSALDHLDSLTDLPSS